MPTASRLRALGAHLRPPAAAAAAPAAAEALEWHQPVGASNLRLLTDAELQRFIVDGFLVLKLDDFEPSFHRKLYDDAHDIFKRSGGSGGGAGGDGLANSNDIYPVIAELGDVMACPTVAGALESVLGPSYQMNSHRHMHNSSKGASDQTFHKDSQRNKPPGHLPHSLFIFYYPAGVTEGMGPTELVPMSQYLGARTRLFNFKTHNRFYVGEERSFAKTGSGQA